MAGHDARVAAAEQLGRPPRRVRVREAVEAEAPQPVAFAPLPRQRVGGGGGRQPGVEGGVEARDRGEVGPRPGHRIERVERGRLVQRRQRRERAQLAFDGRIEADRAGEAGAAVDDAVGHRIGAVEALEGRGELVGVGAAAGRVELLLAGQRVV